MLTSKTILFLAIAGISNAAIAAPDLKEVDAVHLIASGARRKPWTGRYGISAKSRP